MWRKPTKINTEVMNMTDQRRSRRDDMARTSGLISIWTWKERRFRKGVDPVAWLVLTVVFYELDKMLRDFLNTRTKDELYILGK